MHHLYTFQEENDYFDEADICKTPNSRLYYNHHYSASHNSDIQGLTLLQWLSDYYAALISCKVGVEFTCQAYKI